MPAPHRVALGSWLLACGLLLAFLPLTLTAQSAASDADVERLVLFHHRPERSDDEVDRCVERCRALVARRGRALEVVAAAEGMTLQV